jgi:hypothetical protein
MKLIKYVIATGCILLASTGCLRTADGGDQLTGYWRGFIRVNKGASGSIDKTVPLYCKIEQTGNLFIGKYSHAFDANAFKNKLPEKTYDLEGRVAGDKVSIRLGRSDSVLVLPDWVGDLRYSDGRMRGTWLEQWEQSDGNMMTTYEGVIELVRY